MLPFENKKDKESKKRNIALAPLHLRKESCHEKVVIIILLLITIIINIIPTLLCWKVPTETNVQKENS